MAKEPLFPHVPEKREPLYPHRPRGGRERDGERHEERQAEERQAKDKIARDTFGKSYYELSYERQLGVDLAYLRDQGKLHLQTFQGGEGIPPQYRELVGYINEPLPEFSLMAIEAEEGERKIDAVLRELKGGVDTIQQSDNFRLFLATMAKFHDYSIGNQILIMLQMEEATKVAGYNTWKDLGRQVMKGEKGIAIMAPIMPPRTGCPQCGAKIPKGSRYCPQCGREIGAEEGAEAPVFFKAVSVFDISQTEGEPLPEFDVPALTGEANERLFSAVLNLTADQGLEVSFEPKPGLDPALKGFYSGTTIWVRPEEDRAQQLKTLLHETGHYFSEGVFRLPRSDAETIAESAAYVVGAHYGFDSGTRSFPYVALWAKDEKVLKANLASIRKVATTMLEGLEKQSPH